MIILKPAVHLFLADEYLAVANHGRPVTREGLRALCGIGRSTKRRTSGRPIADADEAERLIARIRDERVAEYRAAPELIAAHIAHEEVISRKLARRLLLDLLQNAHDANAAHAVGGRGLGFRSVLAITDAPRIHSGELSLAFHPDRALAVLLEAGLTAADGKAPLTYLPFSSMREEEPAEVQHLLQSYDTVVVMPFRDALARRRLAGEWRAAKQEGRLMAVLFAGAIRTVIWQRRDRSEASQWICRRDKGNAFRCMDARRRA